MNVQDVMERARDAMSVGRVFGEPIRYGSTLVVPVARVAGGAGGGERGSEQGTAESGTGSGFGVAATPAGVFVLKEDSVQWRPAVDLNRIALGGQILMGVGLVILGRVLASRRRR
jgi:uncharacterized spore protein YtfJ